MIEIDTNGDEGAVIVTHHPEANFIDLIESLKSQVSLIVIVDNGSDDSEIETFSQASKASNVELICNPLNLGIAKGLNQGADFLRQRGYRWMLALDQDSRPYPDLVPGLKKAYLSSRPSQNFSIIAPKILDQATEREARFLRSRFGLLFRRDGCMDLFLDDVTLVLSSGCLFDLILMEKVGGFREDFFIDYVDSEYCLRILKEGYKIRVACNAMIDHRLGARKSVRIGPLGFYPTYHSPARWYYISRNRIPMVRMYALKFPHWLSFEIISSVYILFRMLMFEDHRIKKVKAMFYGTIDGLRGRLGEIPMVIAEKLAVE